MRRLAASALMALGVTAGAQAQTVVWVVPTNTINIVPGRSVYSCIANNSNYAIGFTAQVDGALNAVNVYMQPHTSTAVLGNGVSPWSYNPSVRLTYNDMLNGGIRSYAIPSYTLTTADINYLGQVNCLGKLTGSFYERTDPYTGRVTVEFSSWNRPW